MMMPTYTTGIEIAEGDWVRVFVPRLGLWHHGIVRRVYPVWNGCAVEVAHNMKEFGVTASDWYDFADGQQPQLHRRAYDQAQVLEILARVECNLGKPYLLFAQNCEHFASFAFSGKAVSESVNAVGWLAGVAIILRFLE
jgi:hypothetical protein